MQFINSLEKTRLAKKEAKRLAKKEAKMLESQNSTPPSTPTEKPRGEDDGEEMEDDGEEGEEGEDDREEGEKQISPVPVLVMPQRLLSIAGARERVIMECSPLFDPAAPLLLEAGPSAAPLLRDMPPLGMGVKGRVAAIEKKKDGVIPMDEDNE